jgi:hypothetical protein
MICSVGELNIQYGKKISKILNSVVLYFDLCGARAISDLDISDSGSRI